MRAQGKIKVMRIHVHDLTSLCWCPTKLKCFTLLVLFIVIVLISSFSIYAELGMISAFKTTDVC